MGEIFDRGYTLEHLDKPIDLKGTSYIRPSGAITLFEDFNRIAANVAGFDTAYEEWNITAGGTAGAAAVASGSLGGVLTLDSGTDDNAHAIVEGANIGWKANQGGLVFEARVRLNSSIAAVAVCMGLVDAGTYTTTPWALATTTLSDHADVADGVGFLYDTDATTDTVRAVSTAAGTVGTLAAGTMIDTSYVPTVDVFDLYTIRVDAGGAAHFYINDIYKGSIPAALTVTTALEPFVTVGCRTGGAAKTIGVDYILTSAKRIA